MYYLELSVHTLHLIARYIRITNQFDVHTACEEVGVSGGKRLRGRVGEGRRKMGRGGDEVRKGEKYEEEEEDDDGEEV